MSRLLRANLSRLWKNKVFLISLPLMLLLTVITMGSNCHHISQMAAQGYEVENAMEEYYFALGPALGIFFAVVISLFLGTEYSDGTIRNKLILGHTRANVYLANLFASIVSTFALVAVWLLGGLTGTLQITHWALSPTWLCLYMLIALLSSAALAAIFTFIGMLSHNKAATAVISLLLFLGLLLAASMIYNKLAEPEMASEMLVTSNGMEIGEPQPNPSYVGGTARTVLETLLRILPTGQAILMANVEISEPIFPLCASLGIILLVSMLGICIFPKKDIK